MKTLSTLRAEFQELREQKTPSGEAYKRYSNKWKSLQSQIKNYNNITNIMKRAGLKVKSTGIGYFVSYNGFEAHVFIDVIDGAEYWSTDITKGNVEVYTHRHDTKKDAVYSFFCEVNEK